MSFVVTDSAANMLKAFSLPGFETTDEESLSENENSDSEIDDDESIVENEKNSTMTFLVSLTICLALLIHYNWSLKMASSRQAISQKFSAKFPQSFHFQRNQHWQLKC